MNPNEYQELASRTECEITKPSNKLWDTQNLSVRLTHAIMGLISETGEFADQYKKWIFYGQTLDTLNLQEELGDILWYVALACNALDVEMSDIMEANIAKLRKRYSDKFSPEDALEENRDRKAEREVLENQHSDDTVEVPDHPDAEPSRRSYEILCGQCKMKRVYKHNSSSICPDCAADNRLKANAWG